jgi:hypothetical protein
MLVKSSRISTQPNAASFRSLELSRCRAQPAWLGYLLMRHIVYGETYKLFVLFGILTPLVCSPLFSQYNLCSETLLLPTVVTFVALSCS